MFFCIQLFLFELIAFSWFNCSLRSSTKLFYIIFQLKSFFLSFFPSFLHGRKNLNLIKNFSKLKILRYTVQDFNLESNFNKAFSSGKIVIIMHVMISWKYRVIFKKHILYILKVSIQNWARLVKKTSWTEPLKFRTTDIDRNVIVEAKLPSVPMEEKAGYLSIFW